MESESAIGVTIDGDKKNEQTSPQNNYLFVAAIDFGTSYSGYAWSSKNDYKNYLEGKDAEPKIYTNQPWNSGGKGFFSEKNPTCLLLDADRKLVAFGYDAENKYAALSQEGKHSDYYFFQRFKMNLHEGFQIETIDRILRSVFFNELFPFANHACHGSTDFSFQSKEMMATEMNGKQLPAFEVFAMSIKALVDHLMTMFQNKGNMATLKIDDIKWILTVPAIWSEKSKQFMRKSAVKAGIPNSNLSIALEPECASVYCQHLSTDHLYGARDEYSMKETGQKYVVVDLGGGTADIAVHEKIEGNKLKEIHRSTGSNCGGTSVDAAFLKFMDTTFGKLVLETMKKQYPESYLDLMREFESKKRAVNCDETDTIRMSLPMAALSTLCLQIHDKSIEDVILSSGHTEKVSVKTDKLRIKSEIFVEFFMPTIKKLISLLDHIMKNKRVAEVEDILLVGGFAECTILQQHVRDKFPTKRVIVPFDCGLSVLKGAVIYGFDPSYIAIRIIGHTYGVDVAVRYDDSTHDLEHMFEHNDMMYSKSVFKTIIEQETEVSADTKVTREYRTIKRIPGTLDNRHICNTKSKSTLC
ncbi:Hypothetical predicted protein [Mytilus galloprovincialis]|uniref:Uncharacterized protein n=1 Tax=Mytilus galloprovincialis TaxID=29158 RepID=A0A8B6HEP1_MYTGA|nr:Hypothetical predicted protein [Mytilus galloprovincialis]